MMPVSANNQQQHVFLRDLHDVSQCHMQAPHNGLVLSVNAQRLVLCVRVTDIDKGTAAGQKRYTVTFYI